jgi:hypothetical protein
MKLHVIVYENRDDPTLRLWSCWDEEQVDSGDELLERQIADALSVIETARAGVIVVEVDDAVIRPALVRALPNLIVPTVQGSVDSED